MAGKPKKKGVQGRPAYVAFQHETDLTRRIDVRRQRETLLVVTNGERTESDYFDGLRREPWVAVTLRTKFQAGAPNEVVARARQICQGDEYDKVWVVCDVDQYDVSTAIQQAADGAVGLALSVPSFEVWLILHLSDKCPSFNDGPQADQYLRQKLLPSWNKGSLNFSDFRAGVADAVQRAKTRGEPPADNPSTAVWRLVELIGLGPGARPRLANSSPRRNGPIRPHTVLCFPLPTLSGW